MSNPRCNLSTRPARHHAADDQKPIREKEVDITDIKHVPKSEIPNLIIELDAEMREAAEDAWSSSGRLHCGIRSRSCRKGDRGRGPARRSTGCRGAVTVRAAVTFR